MVYLNYLLRVRDIHPRHGFPPLQTEHEHPVSLTPVSIETVGRGGVGDDDVTTIFIRETRGDRNDTSRERNFTH